MADTRDASERPRALALAADLADEFTDTGVQAWVEVQRDDREVVVRLSVLEARILLGALRNCNGQPR